MSGLDKYAVGNIINTQYKTWKNILYFAKKGKDWDIKINGTKYILKNYLFKN